MNQKSGLRAPSKLGRTGLPQPKSGQPTTTGKAQSALEKSARAAGMPLTVAEKYATDLIHKHKGDSGSVDENIAPELQLPPPPVDDFRIGDRVLVGGTKSGVIAYLGETQFAPGEWAGVVLDNPVGKNDGSVAGVRYFQCANNKGVFSRLSKLSYTPINAGSAYASPDAMSEHSSVASTPVSANRMRTANGQHQVNSPSSVKSAGLVRKSLSGSASNLSKTASPRGSQLSLVASTPAQRQALKIGDRVIVSGTKPGVLRYKGAAEFATGEWAGVELDEPLGKNDGAVAGKRYFECKPLYGLFAPVHKVAKCVTGMATPGRKLSMTKYPTNLSRDRSGSQDSVSSISSTTSNTSRTRGAKTGSRPATLSLAGTATTSALQKALKEKEEHIEQLLRERDMERSEVARAASQVDETESQLSTMKSEHDRFREEAEENLQKLKSLVEQLQQEKTKLNSQLDEEKRKVEDLEFTIEEEAITKDDIEVKSENDAKRLSDLIAELEAEKDKTKKHEDELNRLREHFDGEKNKLKSAEQSADYYLDRIEELTHKLSMAENKIKSFENEKSEQGEKENQASEDLRQKNESISRLEDALHTKDLEVKDLRNRLADLEEEYKSSDTKKRKQQDTIDELMQKLVSSDTASSSLNSEVQQLKGHLGELQRQLSASEDKSQQLEGDKTKLESQITELMAYSGDSSQQLSLLNQQLIERDRKVAEFQAALSASTQKAGKLQDQIEAEREQGLRELEVLISKHDEDLKVSAEKLQDAQQEIEKANNKLARSKEQSEQDMEELKEKKDGEISQLRSQITKYDNSIKAQAQETSSLKERLEAALAEVQKTQFEKEKVEKSVKRLENENEALTAEKTELKASQQKLLEFEQNAKSQHGSSEEEIKKLQNELEQLSQKHNQLLNTDEELSKKNDSLQKEQDSLLQDLSKTQAALQEKQLKLQDLTQETEKLQTQCHLQKEELVKSQEESTRNLEEMQQNLAVSEAKCTDLERRIQLLDLDREALKVQVTTLKAVQQEKIKLESTQAVMKGQIEELRQRESQMMDDFEIERTSLQNSLEATKLLLQQKEKEATKLQNDVTALQGETALISSYKSSMKNLEQDKKTLEQRVHQLDLALTESQSNANVITNMDTSGDPVLEQLKADKDAADGQVDFLNSVIVDMQRKNEEMTARLEAMEAGLLNGGSEDDINFRNHTPKTVAPRLFCDICDVFDLHETDDCPRQAMSDSPPASRYHGNQNEQRPYCDICEVFGHWTVNCDDEQTF